MNFGGGYTAEVRRSAFEAELSAAVGGRAMRMHVGLGPDTDSALITIALAHPDITDDMIAAARRAFVAESVLTDTATEGLPEQPAPATVPGAAL